MMASAQRFDRRGRRYGSDIDDGSRSNDPILDESDAESRSPNDKSASDGNASVKEKAPHGVCHTVPPSSHLPQPQTNNAAW